LIGGPFRTFRIISKTVLEVSVAVHPRIEVGDSVWKEKESDNLKK
jgi:hypothetical protein